MNKKKRKKLLNHGMRMIESITSFDQEIAQEYRIKDQLRYNLGEQYYIKIKKHKEESKK